MVKIQYVSDLHLEFEKPELLSGRPEFSLENKVGADILVLAGDITTGKSYRSCERFFENCSKNWKDIVYIAGNHEFYWGDIEETRNEIFQFLYERFKNIHFLDDGPIHRNGIWIFGGTLWTDCNNGDPLTKASLSRGMNDYRLIQWKSRQHWKLRPDDTAELHAQCLSRLKDFLDSTNGEPVVVVTHHGPSKQSIHPAYSHDYHLNGGYVSSLEDRFSEKGYNIPVWIHGHVHNTFDYKFGNIRVLTNPKGYHDENKLFDPNKVIEIS